MTIAVKNVGNAQIIRDAYGTIWELAGEATGLPGLGLAFVEVDVGAESPRHFHKEMSEIYHILEGTGDMWLGDERIVVHPGDTVSIVPRVLHAIGNPGPGPLRFIVVTSPAYDEADDIVVDDAS